MFSRILFLLAIVFIYNPSAYAASPPDSFLNTRILCVLNGSAGDGGDATTREFVNNGLNPGVWSKANENQWIYRVKSKDPVTNKKAEIAFSFIKVTNLTGTVGGGVILERVVENKTDISPINVFKLCQQIHYTVTSLKKKLEPHG